MSVHVIRPHLSMSGRATANLSIADSTGSGRGSPDSDAAPFGDGRPACPRLVRLGRARDAEPARVSQRGARAGRRGGLG